MFLDLTAVLPPVAAYPDLTLLDPRKKNKSFILQYGRAFISQYRNSGSRDFWNGRASGRYLKAEQYANGEQRVKAILKEEEGHADLAGDKIDLRKPLKILKKSLRAVDGKLKDHDFVATCTPIDATAQDEKADYRARLRVWMEHGEFLKSLGLQPSGGAGGDIQGADIPVDEDELDLHMDVKYRHRDAMLLEMKLALALYLSDYSQINRNCLRDETTYGSSVVHLALRGVRRLPMHLHPGDCFFLPSRSENYQHLQAGAHIERLTLAQVLQEIDADPDTTLTPDQREQLVSIARQNMAAGWNGQAPYYDTTLGGQPEMAGQLEVIRFSFKSTDEVVRTEGLNKFGNKQVREKPAGYTTDRKDVKVHRRTVTSWYEGTLILKTEMGYGCRKAYEQLRDEDNPFDCHPLYVVNSPDMLGGFTESIVEQCYTLVDTACEAFSRLRFKLSTMMGSWIEFDLDALESGLLKGSDGKDGSVHDTIKQFFRNGYVVGRKGEGADGRTGKIVDSGELPFSKEIETYWNTIAQAVQQIEGITGINGSISADDPASRQSVGTTQLAIQGAENTLQYLYHAKQSRFERVCRAVAVSIKQAEARQPLVGPVPPGYASTGLDVVGASDTLASRVFTVKVEQKPTDTQWADFYETAKVALTQKEITLADYNFLRQIDNLKQAGAMLGIRAKRNQMQAAQSAQQQTSMASQQQQDSTRVNGEEARETLKVEYSLRMELERLKGENALAQAEVQKQGHIDANELTQFMAFMKQQAQLQSQAAQANTKHDVQLAQHNATLDSQEAQAAAARQHEAELQAQQLAAQPAPAAA
jgi:hypothetical protein